MESILGKYLIHAKKPGGVPFFSPGIAMQIIGECKNKKIPIYGIDAVKITDTYTQPFMEHSNDYTSFPGMCVENVWDDAMQFIKSREHLDLYFEVVFPDTPRL